MQSWVGKGEGGRVLNGVGRIHAGGDLWAVELS